MISRRRFLQTSASLALVPLVPRVVLSSTTLRTRPSWPSFRSGPLYPAFLDAVKKMRGNKNTASAYSWGYWVNVHKNFCPHGKPYFLAWHRGFLYRFEGHLRKVSGNSNLVLPYWNYYDQPQLPAEFMDSSSPLYHANRTGSDVSGALGLKAFGDTIVNFPRGMTNAFEPTLESVPHNPVHNLIGGVMANVSYSPADPIFWVHHANIDRLWVAWVRAGAGRSMPAKSSTYWNGSFSYGPAVSSLARRATYGTGGLGYTYDNRNMPTSGYASSMLATTTTSTTQALLAQPLAAQGNVLGGAAGIALDHRSASLRMSLPTASRDRLRSLLNRPPQPADATSGLRVVLDGVHLTAGGAQGGYFYKVLLNAPLGGVGQPEGAYLLGTLGPFEISAAEHARMMQASDPVAMAAAMAAPLRMEFVATETLRRIWPQPLDALTVSFVRVDGNGAPTGAAITLDQLRLEVDA